MLRLPVSLPSRRLTQRSAFLCYRASSFWELLVLDQARRPLIDGQHIALPASHTSVDCSYVLISTKAHLQRHKQKVNESFERDPIASNQSDH